MTYSVKDIDAYIATFPADQQKRLQQIRKLVHKVVPQATETISYRMPAFRLGKTFFYYAAFKQHIGIYPPVRDKALRAELAPYSNARGNLAFPHKEPLPLELIGRVAVALAAEYENTGK